jgi:hypothetical protein
MTTAFKNQLLGYAQEDINIAKEQGSIMITDTKYGLMTIEMNGKTFVARNRHNHMISDLCLENDMVDFIANSYTIE